MKSTTFIYTLSDKSGNIVVVGVLRNPPVDSYGNTKMFLKFNI